MKNEIKILVIDDDEEDFIIARDLFSEIDRKKYLVDWASSYKEGIKNISEKNHHVYLVDYRLGADDGLELISEVLANGCETPLILLTGQSDIEIDIQAMKVGASDYLVKGSISAVQLERAIRYSIEQAKNLQHIKQLNAGLEHKVKERTLELTAALEREKTMNEMKSRFVSFASHEFRTPLSSILSSASLIAQYKETEQDEKRMKHVERISSSVRNLTEILNDFLSLAKLESGVVEADSSKFNLPELLIGVVEEMDGMVGKKNQKIKYYHEGEETIEQSNKLLKNILLNLLSNASKYSPEEKNIELTSSVINNRVTINVKDNGIGIPEEDQKKLFTEFFRAGNVGSIEGTGLGLNIIKKYVELLNGTISFVSKSTEGTTFTVEFPQNVHSSIN